ncbi:MAG TPA: hypothetical protein VN682_06635, partial [Terriglobales bacterium]|nr:hypothetical protein [Terriglobales bacterium]
CCINIGNSRKGDDEGAAEEDAEDEGVRDEEEASCWPVAATQQSPITTPTATNFRLNMESPRCTACMTQSLQEKNARTRLDASSHI